MTAASGGGEGDIESSLVFSLLKVSQREGGRCAIKGCKDPAARRLRAEKHPCAAPAPTLRLRGTARQAAALAKRPSRPAHNEAAALAAQPTLFDIVAYFT